MVKHVTVGTPRALLGVGDPVLGAERADQLACSTQVCPRHRREQVVLGLGVQSSEDEAGERPAGQIARGEHLSAKKPRSSLPDNVGMPTWLVTKLVPR